MAALEVRVHPRRGRGLYTTRHVHGGETLLVEAPLLLLVPSSMHDVTCAACLRSSQGGHIACPTCQQASFCSQQCAQAATSTPWVHGPDVCRAYQALAASLTDDQDIDAGRFLAHAVALARCHHTHPAAASIASALSSLEGEATDVERRIASAVAPVLQSCSQGPLPLSIDQLACLLRKEQHNSYGILAPPWLIEQQKQLDTNRQDPQHSMQQDSTTANVQGQSQPLGTDNMMGDEEMSEGSEENGRLLRGSALYSLASLINHECNPNVARFDSFDVPGPGSTSVVFRAMHDLPAGTEIFQSYCPLSWDYTERQEHCQSVYGFTCTCQRCKLEETWVLDPTGGGFTNPLSHIPTPASHSKAAPPHANPPNTQPPIPYDPHTAQYVRLPLPGAPLPTQQDEGDQGPLDPTYLQLYLLKYVCPVPDCFGTLAAQAPGSGMLQCSVCGGVRSENDFMSELDTHDHHY